MADQSHLDILQQGVRAWNSWRLRNPDPYIIPDLSGVNLPAGANLRFANLSRTNLSGASLYDVNFSDANLYEADLSRSSLVKTNLTGTTLTGCRIYGISAWNLKLEGAKQHNLNVSDDGEPALWWTTSK